MKLDPAWETAAPTDTAYWVTDSSPVSASSTTGIEKVRPVPFLSYWLIFGLHELQLASCRLTGPDPYQHALVVSRLIKAQFLHRWG